MSTGPANALRRAEAGAPQLARSAVVMGTARLGEGSLLAEGAVIRARGAGGEVGTGSAVLENSVVVGTTEIPDDLARLLVLREGDLSVPPRTAVTVESTQEAIVMGQLYAYRGTLPSIAASAILFPTAEITGDVVVGERTIIGAGVKIIGDSHGPVRIGRDVQILENTVLHLLPDNDLIIEDGAIVGPGAMIHGCRIGARSVVEPGAIVCDGSTLGAGCIVRAGAVVKQRSRFGAGTDVDGFPAVAVGHISALPPTPDWALRHDDLPVPVPNEPDE